MATTISSHERLLRILYNVPIDADATGLIPTSSVEEMPALPSACLRRSDLEGQGQNGSVYKVFHEDIEQPFALKVVPLPPGEAALTDPLISGELMYVQSLARRWDQPHSQHLVIPYGAYVGSLPPHRERRTLVATAGVSYCVLMEYMDASSLLWYVEATRLYRSLNLRPVDHLPISKAVVSGILLQLVLGLLALQKERLLHRDLKPDNILLTRSGAVKIADFGCVGELSACPTVTICVGAPLYKSPERLQGGVDRNETSDAWAVAVVILELLTGEHLLSRATEALRKFDPRLLRLLTAILNPVREERPYPREVLASEYFAEAYPQHLGPIFRSARSTTTTTATCVDSQPVAALAAPSVNECLDSPPPASRIDPSVAAGASAELPPAMSPVTSPTTTPPVPAALPKPTPRFPVAALSPQRAEEVERFFADSRLEDAISSSLEVARRGVATWVMSLREWEASVRSPDRTENP